MNGRVWQRVHGEWVEVTALVNIPLEDVRAMVQALQLVNVYGNAMLKRVDGVLQAENLVDYKITKVEP